MRSQQFSTKFSEICQIDNLPEVSLKMMKIIKGNLMDKIVST